MPLYNLSYTNRNLLDPAKVTQGYLVVSTGSEYPNADKAHTEKIPVKPGKTYSGLLKNGGSPVFQYSHFMDLNENWVSGGHSNMTINGFTVPENAYYVILTFDSIEAGRYPEEVGLFEGTNPNWKDFGDELQISRDLPISDESYRYKAIMGENNLTLIFNLAEAIEFPIGSFVDFDGERYTLLEPAKVVKNGERKLEYTLLMESAQNTLSIFKLRNTVDKRLKFPFTAKPVEHLQQIIDNLNERDTGWVLGNCIDASEKLINYNHTDCFEALRLIAEAFETEWEIDGRVIHLKKVEYFKEDPLPLSYGKGNGFVPGLGRANYANDKPIEVLFVQGSDRNIDFERYGSKELLLPKNASLIYEGNKYITDPNGYSVRRGDKALATKAEGSFDCTHIYPSRVGEVTEVIEVDPVTNSYDFIDENIPADLDYAQYRITGEKITILFQSGILSGREFDIEQEDNSVSGYIHADRRFKLVPQDTDGQTMPNDTFKPAIGDKYIVLGMMLPDAYVSDDATETGASWDMFREAAKHLYENETPRFTFTGEVDGIWARKNWGAISPKIKPGGYIDYSDAQFQQTPVPIRITGVKQYFNTPYSPIVELSNIVSGTPTASRDIKRIKANEVELERVNKQTVQFTKRRFTDAFNTMKLLDAAIKGFSGAVNPISVHTMQLIAGDESLQFRFVTSTTSPSEIPHTVTWDNSTKRLTCPAGIIQHMSLGITDISANRQADDYKFWILATLTSSPLTDGSKSYYLYARGLQTQQYGEFVLSETAIGLEEVAGYYHLLVGILNSETDGDRSFVTMYGFTEILPGRITTDRIVSSDGNNFFDMVANAFKLGGSSGPSLSFNEGGNGALKLKGSIAVNPGGIESEIGVFRGAWVYGTTYYKGDSVTREGSTWRAKQNIAEDDFQPVNWELIASAGINGTNGLDGLYTEYRYAQNGSTLVAPSVAAVRNPSGWTTAKPSPQALFTIWRIQTTVDPEDDSISGWSTPSMETYTPNGNITINNKGEYNGGTTYSGSSSAVDAVHYNGIYYYARPDAGTIAAGTLPTDTSKFNPFSASFSTLAAGLVLASKAVIKNLIAEEIITATSGKRIEINKDGNNAMKIYDAANNVVGRIDDDIDTFDGQAPGLDFTSADGYAQVSASGIFANHSNVRPIPSSAGFDARATIAAIGNGDIDETILKAEFLAAVYGRATNNGDAPFYGGYFERLFAAGLSVSLKTISSAGNYTIAAKSTYVISYSSDGTVYVTLPPNTEAFEGHTILFKNIGNSNLQIQPNTNQVLFDDNTSNAYLDIAVGRSRMATRTKLVNGSDYIWVITNAV